MASKQIAATLILAALLAAAMGLGRDDDRPTQTTVYIVRHAEKVDQSRDAALSDAGRERAATLAWVLRDVKFDAAYSTDYQRTRNTIAPLVEAQKLDLDVSTPPTKLADAIRARNVGQTVLICGHSNTVPMLLRDLGVDFTTKLLDSYDNLFVVTLVQCERGQKPVASLQRLHYPGRH